MDQAPDPAVPGPTVSGPTVSGPTVPAATSGPVRVAAVALGGAVGASLRWGLDVAVGDVAVGEVWAVPGWPLGTLLANLLGTFVLAVLSTRLGTAPWAIGLTVGVLGAFTTFSALVVQAVDLADRPVLALASVLVSLVGGVGAAALGLRLGRPRDRPRRPAGSS